MTLSSGSVDEAIRRRFEASWRDGEGRPIEAFLPPPLEPALLPTLVELCLIELELAWKQATAKPLVEGYLERYPELAEREQDLLELLQQEYHCRHAWGDAPDAAEYQRRFPALVTTADEVTGLWDTRQAQRAASPGLGAALGDRYEVLDELGRGGMGVVYRVRDTTLGRVVALKVVRGHASDEQRQRFLREASAMAQLKHPGIVQVYDVGEAEGHLYLTMELVEGGTLSEALTDGAPLPSPVALAIAERVALALAAVHSSGFVHRDVKPSNILLEPATEDSHDTVMVALGDGPATPHRILLSDFGLVREVDSTLTRTDQFLGTPAYMSPEQTLEGAVGATSDIYSLGAVLYQMLTGRLPFHERDVVRLLEQIRVADPPTPRQLVPSMPRDLDTIVRCATAKNPERRYANALALAEDLRRAIAGEPIRARPASLAYRAWRRIRRHRTSAVGVLVFLVTVLAFGIWWVTRPGFVRLEVTPADARVTVNGRVLSTEETATELELPAGLVTIEATAADHLPARTAFELGRAERQTTALSLERRKGTLSWRSSVPGALTRLTHSSGQLLRLGTPFENLQLATGTWRLRLSAPRHYPAETQYDLTEGLHSGYTYLPQMVAWELREGYVPGEGFAVADITGDGTLSLAAQTMLYYTVVLDAERGTELWRDRDLPPRFGMFWGQADDDGPLELLTMLKDGTLAVRAGLTGRRKPELEAKLPATTRHGWVPMVDATHRITHLVWTAKGKLAASPWPLAAEPAWELPVEGVRALQQVRVKGTSAVAVAATRTLSVRALDTGRALWSKPLHEPLSRAAWLPGKRDALVVLIHGGDLLAFDVDDGRPRWRVEASLEAWSEAQAIDVNGDGQRDLVVVVPETMVVIDGASGAVLHRFPQDAQAAGLAHGDPDGDGTSELWWSTLDGVVAQPLHGGAERDVFPLGFSSDGLAADVDGDGLTDYLYRSPGGGIGLAKAPKARWHAEYSARLRARPVVGDWDRDGRREVFVVALTGSNGLHDLETGERVASWGLEPLGGHYGSDPQLFDLDGDGRDEIVIGRYADHGHGAIALKPDRNEPWWVAREVGRTQAPVARIDRDVLVATFDAKDLVRLEGTTGEVRWRRPLPAPANAAPVVTRHGVAQLSTDGSLSLVDGTSGKLLHRASAPTPGGVGWGTPLRVDEDTLVYALHARRSDPRPPPVVAYDLKEHRQRWVRRFPRGAVQAPGLWRGPSGPVLLHPGLDGVVRALRVSDGSDLWQLSVGKPLTGTPQVADLDGDGRAELVLMTRAGLAVFDLADRRLQWSFRVPEGTEKVPWIVPQGDGPLQQLVLGGFDRNVHCLTGRGRRNDGAVVPQRFTALGFPLAYPWSAWPKGRPPAATK